MHYKQIGPVSINFLKLILAFTYYEFKQFKVQKIA